MTLTDIRRGLIRIDADPHRLTLSGLIDHYHADPESSVHGLRFHVRDNHRGLA